MVTDSAVEVGKPAGKGEPDASAMFGRSMLYVLVGSFQLLVTSLVSPVLAYLLAPGEFGQISLALSVYQLLFILAVFGFDQVLVIYHSEDDDGPERARRLLGSIVIFSLLLCGAFAVSEPIWRSLVGVHHNSGVLVAAVLWVGPSAANAFTLALLRAQDRIASFCVVSLLSAIGGQVAGLLALLLVERDPTLYAASGVVTQLVALVIGTLLVRPKFLSPLGLRALRATARLSVPIAANAISLYVLSTSDRIVISRELGEVAVGRYQVAYVVGSSILLLLGLLNGAWLPQILKLRSVEQRERVSRESRNRLLWMLVPIVAGIVVAAPVLLRIVAPSSFEPNSLTAVATVVALSAFPIAHIGASSRLLIARRRQSAIAWVTAAAGVLNIVLNIALIPGLEILGSAIATLAAFVFQAVVLSCVVYGRTFSLPPSLAVAILAVAAVAIGALTLPVTTDWLVGRMAVGVALGVIGLAQLQRARKALSAAVATDVQSGAAAHDSALPHPLPGPGRHAFGRPRPRPTPHEPDRSQQRRQPGRHRQ